MGGYPERRERRKVVVLNKLGQAAAEVRQAWVKDTLLSRKTPPKGAAMFIARQLCEHPHLITAHSTKETTRALLGLAEGHTISAAVSALPPTGDPRATVITLGLVLAAMEAELCGVSGSVHCSDVLPLRISQRQGCRYRGMPARRWFGSARAI